MTIPVDITLLEETKGPIVTLLSPTTIRASGTGEAYAGFDGLDRLQLVVEARNLRGNTTRSLTVTVQQSDDGLIWTTAATHAFTGNDTYRVEIDTPDDQLRVIWTAAGGLTSATVGPVTVTPGFIDDTGGGTSPLLVATKHLSSADLLALDNDPGITVVAAPGDGMAVFPLGGVMVYTAGDTPYTVTKAGGGFAEFYFAHDGAIASTISLGALDPFYVNCGAGFLDAAEDQLRPLVPEDPWIGSGTFVLPLPLVNDKAFKVYFAWTGDGDSLADGDGTVDITLPYMLVTLL